MERMNRLSLLGWAYIVIPSVIIYTIFGIIVAVVAAFVLTWLIDTAITWHIRKEEERIINIILAEMDAENTRSLK